MLQSIAFWKRISISVTMIALLLFSVTDIFAQGQTKNDQTTRIQTIRAIQEANDHYYEKRYADAIKAYQALLKNELEQSQKDSMRLMLGQSHAKLGEDKEARRIFKRL